MTAPTCDRRAADRHHPQRKGSVMRTDYRGDVYYDESDDIEGDDGNGYYGTGFRIYVSEAAS